MRCSKCNEEMFNATLTGNALYPLILSNKKKGILEPEKRCYVLCYVCPECGYIELYAEKPKELKIDWQILIWRGKLIWKTIKVIKLYQFCISLHPSVFTFVQ